MARLPRQTSFAVCSRLRVQLFQHLIHSDNTQTIPEHPFDGRTHAFNTLGCSYNDKLWRVSFYVYTYVWLVHLAPLCLAIYTTYIRIVRYTYIKYTSFGKIMQICDIFHPSPPPSRVLLAWRWHGMARFT